MQVFRQLRVWFLIILAVGTAGIVIGWMVNSWLLTLIVPLGAMALYPVVAYFKDRSLFVTYVLADSFYFLGFLFTLISLFVSLLAFSQGEAGPGEISGAVSRFGVALATTIFGLAFRVFLVNFRPEIDDTLAQSEKALTDASVALRGELDRLNADLVVQTSGWTASLSHAIATANAELQGAYSAGALANKKASEELAMSAKAGGLAVTNVLKDLTEQIGVAATSLGTASSELVDRFGSLQIDQDVLTRPLQPALEGLVTSLKECGSSLEDVRIDPRASIEALENLTKSLRRAAQDVDGLTGSFSELDPQKLTLASREYVAMLEAVGGALRAQRDGLNEIQEELRRNSTLAATHRQDLEQEVASARTALADVSRAMVEAARFVVSELQGGRQG